MQTAVTPHPRESNIVIVSVSSFATFLTLSANNCICCFSFQRSAADQILRDLQNNPDMWLQVVHILQNSQNLNTKFFALQVSLSTHWLCL